MFINTKHRSIAKEILDSGETGDKELLEAYNDINTVNKLLGGNQITLDGIIQLTKHLPADKEVTIIDIGCGDGEILFRCEQYAQKNKLNWKLVGVDINEKSIDLAYKRGPKNSQATFEVLDIFSNEFDKKAADIFLFSLTLHHFSDTEIMSILEKANQQAKVGVVINDLQRSAIAYRLFQLFGFFFLKSEIAKSDGLTSILRGFKKNDLKQFALKLPQGIHLIYYRWAFRWQWIIKKHAS
jgi:ubiquinone/menaquinone biosynthesis C-methylase UbiE